MLVSKTGNCYKGNLVDVTQKGEVLGLEILDASRNIGKVKKERVPIEITPYSYQRL